MIVEAMTPADRAIVLEIAPRYDRANRPRFGVQRCAAEPSPALLLQLSCP